MFTITPSTLPNHLLEIDGDISSVAAGDVLIINGTDFPVRAKLLTVTDGKLSAKVLVAKTAVRAELVDKFQSEIDAINANAESITNEVDQLMVDDEFNKLNHKMNVALGEVLVSKYGFVDTTPAAE